MRLLAVALFLLSFQSSILQAGTLVVDASGGGDYLEIAEAIGAAQDGDRILVRPGTYTGFTIDQRDIMILAARDPFTVTGEVEIKNLSVQSTAGIKGMQVLAGTVDARLHITNSRGQILLDAVDLISSGNDGRRIQIHDSDNVQITGLTTQALGRIDGNSSFFAHDENAFLHISHSVVRIHRGVLNGIPGRNGYHEGDFGGSCYDCSCIDPRYQPMEMTCVSGFDGGTAVRLENQSSLVLSQPLVQGGAGGKSEAATDINLGELVWGAGGDGGHGFSIDPSSKVHLIGKPQAGHFLSGGDGGDAGPWCTLFNGPTGFGGNGGQGAIVETGGSLTYGHTALIAGLGGQGNPDFLCGVPGGPGLDGSPLHGSANQDPKLPYLHVNRNLVQGGAMTATLDSPGHPGIVLFFLSSDAGSKVLAPVTGGPALGAVDGGNLFAVWNAGQVPSSGILQDSLGIPDQPLFLGFPVHWQAAVLESGNWYLSNAVTRIIGEE